MMTDNERISTLEVLIEELGEKRVNELKEKECTLTLIQWAMIRYHELVSHSNSKEYLDNTHLEALCDKGDRVVFICAGPERSNAVQAIKDNFDDIAVPEIKSSICVEFKLVDRIESVFIPKKKHLPKGHERPYKFHR